MVAVLRCPSCGREPLASGPPVRYVDGVAMCRQCWAVFTPREEVRGIFLRLWDQAVGHDGYDKRCWQQVQQLMDLT
jgi:hypothetical protein